MLRFTYKHGGIEHQYFFRIGDVVKVKHWGAAYSGWSVGNRYFTGDTKNPFYNEYWKERKDEILFKVKNVVLHQYDGEGVICYIEDRYRKGIIINANALEVVKQFPLRKGERQIIEIKKIK